MFARMPCAHAVDDGTFGAAELRHGQAEPLPQRNDLALLRGPQNRGRRSRSMSE